VHVRISIALLYEIRARDHSGIIKYGTNLAQARCLAALSSFPLPFPWERIKIFHLCARVRTHERPYLCNRRALRPTNDITSSVTNVEIIRCRLGRRFFSDGYLVTYVPAYACMCVCVCVCVVLCVCVCVCMRVRIR